MRVSSLVLAALLASLLIMALSPVAGEPPADARQERTEAAIRALADRADNAVRAQKWIDAEDAFAQLVSLRPDEGQFVFGLARATHMRGDYERAIPAHMRAAEFPAFRAPSLYNLACAYARLGRADDAIDALREAAEAGFDAWDAMASDPDLEAIRDDPRLGEIREDAVRTNAFPALTWDTIPQRLEAMADRGYSGSVLIVRGGRVVLDDAFGFADREHNIPNRPDTIYCVGSTPIDFTKAAILLLNERGKLTLDDPITEYFDRVPEDKRAITIRQLMTGASGLQNFHDLPSDRDVDHSWIDRDTAVRRILSFPLLFEPGTGREHSHSAWGMLGAIVEIASGETYEEFITRSLLDPAGMHDTFDYGRPIPRERMAIGYGRFADGEINAPPYWGPTSWLVKASGGMVSTTHDMNRWHEALYSGKLLSDDSLELYFGAPGEVLNGGSRYGYEISYCEGPSDRFYITSNSIEGHRLAAGFADDLGALISGRTPPPYTLGLALGDTGDGRITIAELLPGGAGERAGLRVGDVLISLNGVEIAPDPYAAVSGALRTGEPVACVIERDGVRREIVVTPARR
ncbi:MAG: serine hydrolase [Phycisphaerales bacterium]|nr:serine hydrolase [Phycisphaerales bacterium]